MATQPDHNPDRIEPQAPPERPNPPTDPIPGGVPDEVNPTTPDVAEPGRGPDEIPNPR